VGVTATYISYLEREVGPTGVGEGMRPMIEVVDAVAGALGVLLAEARCAAGHNPPEESQVSCEVVKNTFRESDFATLHHMYEQLTPEQRRTFQPILEMVRRELELMLKGRDSNREGNLPGRRRRPELSRRLPRRAGPAEANSGKSGMGSGAESSRRAGQLADS
ncbi:MAG: hypothetical protein LC802_24015, partial [Acidobacteria bacterium]|nr:hypothetical protein [Acidobacteriota bacterium]